MASGMERSQVGISIEGVLQMWGSHREDPPPPAHQPNVLTGHREKPLQRNVVEYSLCDIGEDSYEVSFLFTHIISNELQLMY